MQRRLSFDERVCRFEFRPLKDNPERIIRLMVDAGVEVLVASGMHGQGAAVYPTDVAVPHPELDPAYLPELVRLARKHDVMLISWYNMAQNLPMSRRHPDWRLTALRDGIHVADADGFCCLFSSPYREFVKTYSREILDQGFEGLWYDGAWAGAPDALSCYCEYCRRAFEEETGREIPAAVAWEDDTFHHWVQWRYARFDRFVTELHDDLIAHRPDAIVMMNHYNRPNINSSEPSEGTSWRNGVPIDVMSFPGGGGNENTSIMNRLHTTGFNARIVKAQCPSRFDVWEPGGTVWRSVLYSFLENDKTHSILHGLWVLALGGVPWTALENSITTRGRPDPALMDALKKRRPYVGGEPLRYCAIHYSQSSRDFWARETPNAYYTEVLGLYQAAVEARLLVDLVLDRQIEDVDHLKRYAVVVLPNTACMTERQADALRRYVHDGGVLISTFATSLCDEQGRRGDNFQLAELFAVDFRKEVQLTPGPSGATIYARDNYPLETRPMRILDAAFKEETAAFAQFGANYCEVRAQPGAAVFANTCDVQSDGRPASGYELTFRDVCPAVVVHPHGRGTSVYIAHEAGRGFIQWPNPENRRLLERFLMLGNPTIRVRAPKLVETSAFRKTDGVLAIHLVHLPFSSTRPPIPPMGIPVVDEIVPLHDIEVRVRGVRARRVSLPVSGQSPEVRREEDDLIVRIPELVDHEVVWIEMEKPAKGQ